MPLQAALGTPLATRQVAGHIEVVPTGNPHLPIGVTGVVGLNGALHAQDHGLGASLTLPSLPAGPGTTSAGCAGIPAQAYTPAQLAGAYGLAGGAAGSGQTVGIMELSDYASSDVAAYQACLGSPAQTITRVPVDGGAPVGFGTDEATYDVETLAGLVPGAQLLVYEAPNTEAGMLADYAAMINQDRAQVITTSWGVCEAQQDPAMASAENTLFQEAAVQGQTVLAASGDLGSQDCNNGATGIDTSLQVDDPASQPFVTGVGGTTLASLNPRIETVWNSSGASGGGISRRWPMPAWQASAVMADSSGTPCGATTGYCRQVPDVSASADPAHGYPIFCTAGDCNGQGWFSGGGTSLAAPVWAALVADINQGCGGTGRVGFINPVLYSTPGVTHDITIGSNAPIGSPTGLYPAGPGYDMASGLGSPNGAALAQALCGSSSYAPASAVTSAPGSSSSSNSSPIPGSPTVLSSTAGSYWLAGADGTMHGFGGLVSSGPAATQSPVTAVAVTPDRGGYWLLHANGSVSAHGDAVALGSPRLPGNAVGIVSTSDGRGYWIVASDGGIFTYGDAAFYGSAGAIHLTRPIVGMAATPDGHGYWLVASDGGIFTYGDAAFYGSAGAIHLARPIVGMAATPDGHGYWMVASDGGIFTYGDAAFLGSAAGASSAPIVGMVAG
ncbi:MAG: S53 family peptidase [Acidimicrobiales bacterium]